MILSIININYFTSVLQQVVFKPLKILKQNKQPQVSCFNSKLCKELIKIKDSLSNPKFTLKIIITREKSL